MANKKQQEKDPGSPTKYRLPYGLAEREGLNTDGKSPSEVWEMLKGHGVEPKTEYEKLRTKKEKVQYLKNEDSRTLEEIAKEDVSDKAGALELSAEEDLKEKPKAKSFDDIRAEGKLNIKNWYNVNYGDGWDLANSEISSEAILRETEKAVYVQVEVAPSNYGTDYTRTIKTWIPKAAFESLKDVEERENRWRAKAQQAREAGKAKYDKLVAWAKDHNVKGVRDRMKTSTIMELIEKAGLHYEE